MSEKVKESSSQLLRVQSNVCRSSETPKLFIYRHNPHMKETLVNRLNVQLLFQKYLSHPSFHHHWGPLIQFVVKELIKSLCAGNASTNMVSSPEAGSVLINHLWLWTLRLHERENLFLCLFPHVWATETLSKPHGKNNLVLTKEAVVSGHWSDTVFLFFCPVRFISHKFQVKDRNLQLCWQTEQKLKTCQMLCVQFCCPPVAKTNQCSLEDHFVSIWFHV